MRHLCDCLSEPTGKRWQRIYGGLVLTEKLVQQGSHILIVETAHGHHFDLVQKVSFLEHFDLAARGCSDRHAEQCVRKKASELRSMLVPQLERASAEELPQNVGLGIKDSASVRSPGSLSLCTTADMSLGGSSLRSGSSADNFTDPGPPPRRGPGPAPAASAAGLLERLRALTEAEVSGPAREHFGPVLAASRDADNRRAIMWHLQSCLAEPAARDWRPVHGGLLLAEVLMEHGSPLIFTEPTPGVSLDLPKQIWFLEQFEYRENWRAQNLVRKKAIELREKMVPWLLSAVREEEEREEGEFVPEGRKQIDEAFSTLRFWAESLDVASSSTSGTSVEASPSEVMHGASDPDLHGEVPRNHAASVTEAPKASDRQASGRTPAVSAFSEAACGDAAAAADVFFTPPQTPAVGPARGCGGPHLISL